MDLSNKDIIERCDNFPYSQSGTNPAVPKDEYYKFKLDGCSQVLGLVAIDVARRLPVTDTIHRDDNSGCIVFHPGTAAGSNSELEHRTTILAEYLQDLKERKLFKVLDGWRDELYPVYSTHWLSPGMTLNDTGSNLLFSMERAASALFGIVTYGVHMTAYVGVGADMRIWTPKRSPTKQTYPGMMDNTVAGGLSTGERPKECLIRECEEEASLPEAVSCKAKAAGTVTYFHIRDSQAGGETGLCQPECQYVYDLELSADIVPQPGDDEAIDFQLLSIAQINTAMKEGKFKPNCAVVLLDFFVRHGVLSAENEQHYFEIVSRLHRPLPYPCKDPGKGLYF